MENWTQYNCSLLYDEVPMNVSGELILARNYTLLPCADGPQCPTLLHMCQNFPPKAGVPVNGYISPMLIFMTIINNVLVSVVLLRKNMRSPTNCLLVSMAIADTLTGIFALPMLLEFYATDKYRDYVPYAWCFVVTFIGVYIPTIFHTASIWLTVGLAVQRYIYVCHSFLAKSICTTRNVIIGTIVIYIVSTIFHITRFFENTYMRVAVLSLTDANNVIEGCEVDHQDWVKAIQVPVYFGTYFWCRVIFIHLVPCVTLVVLNALLIYAMRKAQKRRKILLQQNRRSESKRLKDSNCTTMMLVAVVGLFLLVEFPLGIIILLRILENTIGAQLIARDHLPNFMLFANLFILVSYPLNFFIYCGMSRQFRSNFKRLFRKSSPDDKDGQSVYHTLQTENGKTVVNTEETVL